MKQKHWRKNPESEGTIEATLPKERKKRPVDPEREARRAARKAEREAKNNIFLLMKSY